MNTSLWVSRHVLFICAAVLSAGMLCGCPTPRLATGASPSVLPDLNPDPNIVEVELTARVARVQYAPGVTTRVYTYNGTVPGPTIRANVGDTLIVHFRNRLPEETTVHWHGVELPAVMDGSNISQHPVPPGEDFTYEFQINRATTYWYHPHVRGNEQVELGLYGALVVSDPDAIETLDLPEQEHVLLLDDVLLDADGTVAAAIPEDPAELAVVLANGREGNQFLLNGRSNAALELENGVPHRMRLVNVSNTRFMRVGLSGQDLWRIGGDGGLLEAPYRVFNPREFSPEEIATTQKHGPLFPIELRLEREIILTPGERADIVFLPRGDDGDEIELAWFDMPRGRHDATQGEGGVITLGHPFDDGLRAPVVLATYTLRGDELPGPYSPAEALSTIDAIDVAEAETLPFVLGHSQPDNEGNIMFFFQMKDGMPLPYPMVTPDDAPKVQPNDVRLIQVTNLTGGDHNFHIHGFHFQPLETIFVDDEDPENGFSMTWPRLEEVDTVRVPRRLGAFGTTRTIVRAAIRFDDAGREGQIYAEGGVPGDGTSGGWLAHCHILEHMRRGMATYVQVVP